MKIKVTHDDGDDDTNVWVAMGVWLCVCVCGGGLVGEAEIITILYMTKLYL